MFGFMGLPPCPKFKVGDTVSYELSWWGKPRWIGNKDRGGSGHWEDGVVTAIADKAIQVKGRTGTSAWPLLGHKIYKWDQWSWAGYLKQVKTATKTSSKCVCGSEAVYGPNGPHSDWCNK